MKDYFELLETISKEYHIVRGSKESEESWMARVIYSFLGETGYSSLWDVQEDLQPASITHFKTRIEQTLDSLLDIYPEMLPIFSSDCSPDCSLQSEEIYRTVLNAASVYHTQYRLLVPPRKAGAGNTNIYLRGYSLTEKRRISGLGCYFPRRGEDTEEIISLAKMHQFHSVPLDELWTQTVSDAQWMECLDLSGFQYLRTEPPFTIGDWSETPGRDQTASLARKGSPGAYLYFLYEAGKRDMRISQLPAWLTENEEYKEYRLLSNACLHARGTLPPSLFQRDGEIVHLCIQYLYPPEELNAIRLYSWPQVFISYPQYFKRTMSSTVFDDFRNELEKIGYQFTEE